MLIFLDSSVDYPDSFQFNYPDLIASLADEMANNKE